jgi:putative flippase GtrA
MKTLAAERSTPVNLKSLFERVFKFAITSGLGLALDVCIFLGLTWLGTASGWANLVSATCGVTFVYFASIYRVFSYNGERLVTLLVFYLAYQAVAVALASWAVGVLATLTSPIVAKLLILPVTFTANYVFMHLITRGRQRAVAKLERPETVG